MADFTSDALHFRSILQLLYGDWRGIALVLLDATYTGSNSQADQLSLHAITMFGMACPLNEHVGKSPDHATLRTRNGHVRQASELAAISR